MLNALVIYFLLRRRISFTKCQNRFIVNLSVSDAMLSVLGVFRGLGIIDSRFVGAVNGSATFYCKLHLVLLHTFGNSSLVALLPLTIDRAVAIILPLKHGILITKKSSSFMFATMWTFTIIAQSSIMIIDYFDDSVKIRYSEIYHRCENYRRNAFIDRTLLFSVPFMLVTSLYGTMLFIIIKTKRSCGRFLLTACGIISTSLIFYIPGVILDTANLHIGYKATQVLYVTFWYVNGVINPLIYVGRHPKTWEFVQSKLGLI